jgi:protease II
LLWLVFEFYKTTTKKIGNSSFETKTVRYETGDMLTPRQVVLFLCFICYKMVLNFFFVQVFELDLRSGISNQIYQKKAPQNYDRSLYESKRIWAKRLFVIWIWIFFFNSFVPVVME